MFDARGQKLCDLSDAVTTLLSVFDDIATGLGTDAKLSVLRTGTGG